MGRGGRGITEAAIDECDDVFDTTCEMGADLSLLDEDNNPASFILACENWNDTEFNTTLLDACIGGDLARVKFILSDGRADINSVGKDNMTPVMHAAKEGHREVFDLLNVVGVSSRDHDGLTPAMTAALYKRKDVFDLLVEAGADLLLVNEFGGTILHVACEGGNVQIVKYLMKHNIVDIESRDMNGWTPVMQAAIDGHKDVFDVLVKAGADLSQVSNNKETTLHLACVGGNIEIIMYFMKYGIVDIDSRDINGWTPVMNASSAGHKDVFDVLVEAGADLSQVSNEKETILHIACRGENVEIFKYLMKHDIVDIDSRDMDGWTPVMSAVSDGQKDMFKVLVQKGQIYHNRDTNGWTPVMQAISAGHMDVFDVLVEAGADLSQVSNKKETILHIACGGENVDIVKYLMKHDIVDIDSRDMDGWTPVMNAVRDGQKDMFNLLVSKGADLSQVRDDKQTILHMACGGGNTEIIKYLLKHTTVDIDSRDTNGWTPVMQAAIDGHKDVFDVLVKAGADLSQVRAGSCQLTTCPNMRCLKIRTGKTECVKGADLSKVDTEKKKKNILHVACARENVEIIKNLLKHDIVDIDSRDKDGLTPVMYTAKDGCKDVFGVLVKWGADLSLLDDANDNILHLACNGNSVEIVKYLLSHNIVDIDSRDREEYTPAMIAACQGHEAIFFLLVEHEADLTIINDVGDNILDMACEGGNKNAPNTITTVEIMLTIFISYVITLAMSQYDFSI
ncbi:ankyrin repeat domain-containing protein 50-like [Haliotis rubra]|uniref:ankyrin repeat domain-containing protein 50-like n=1 Tax=Haliotis rubra TaxID=36100 RepID=UPI001EE59D15|nr:ankyrin repeat domain-containing protein 50-like [Haliotis rubra]